MTGYGSIPISDAERRLGELLESAPDAIFEIDQSGKILLLNRMAERLFGYDRVELLGQTLEVLLPENLRNTHRGHRARYLENPVTRPMGHALNLKGRRRDGSHFPVEISLSPVPCDEGFHISAIVRDTTDRDRAAQLQRESDQLFRLMIDAVKDYAILTLDPNGFVVSWNEGARRIKQYTADEIIGQHCSVFYPPGDRDFRPHAGLELVRATGRFEEEGWRVRKDGTPFWASVLIAGVHGPDGELVGFSKVTKDLTERKQAADELRIVQQKYIAELERR